MRQAALFAVLVVATLAVFASSPYIIPQPPTSLRTFSERQMFATTGIVYQIGSSGTEVYLWGTTFRSETRSAVVSIQAELYLSGAAAPVTGTKFFVGLALIGPNDPLPHNLTANMETTQLAPPTQGFFHIGQSFPEVVSVTFLNGTSTQLSISAQVIKGPNFAG